MGSFDETEVGGLPTLYNINTIKDPGYHSLYGDDHLIIIDNSTQRNRDIMHKKLHWLLNKFSFRLEIQTNLKIVNFLDITLNHCVSIQKTSPKILIY